jgi:hypothetical protein
VANKVKQDNQHSDGYAYPHPTGDHATETTDSDGRAPELIDRRQWIWSRVGSRRWCGLGRIRHCFALLSTDSSCSAVVTRAEFELASRRKAVEP